MASDSGIDSQSSPELTEDPPMSRTHQYRHMIKPMLERKRRARINKCLDELKDLMVSALQKDGESITKLEKADVLELTVRHLRKLKSHGALGLSPVSSSAERYRAGYTFCAGEISKYVASGTAGMDVTVSARLLHHLSHCIRNLESVPPSFLSLPPSHPPMMMSTLSPMSPPHSNQFKPPQISEYFSQSKLEALRYSLGQQGQPKMLKSPEVYPKQHQLHHVVKAEVALVPGTESVSDKEDDKAWRPWNIA